MVPMSERRKRIVAAAVAAVFLLLLLIILPHLPHLWYLWRSGPPSRTHPHFGPAGPLASRFGNTGGTSAAGVYSILCTEEGFLAATGDGVCRYKYKEGVPAAAQYYDVSDGLPSDTCYLLERDARGARHSSSLLCFVSEYNPLILSLSSFSLSPL
jgi:hypothetical protein